MGKSISVLIPAYNAEKTIKKTLESLLNQTKQEFEVVIVNDGSSDGTQKILEEYQKKSALFRVYTQENAGVSATRQMLIEKASGTHFLFCDADDYFEPNAVEVVMNAIEDSGVDLIVFGYRLIRKNALKSVVKRQLQRGTYVKDEWKLLHINGLTDLYYSVLWNKCYKKELIKKTPSLKFENIMEDVIFNVEYMERCKSILILEEVLYNYVQIGDSLTRGEKVDSEQGIQEAFNTFKNLKNALEITYPNTSDYINCYMYIMLSSLCERANRIGNVELYLSIRKSELFLKIKKQLSYKRYKLIVMKRIGQIKRTIRTLVRQ